MGSNRLTLLLEANVQPLNDALEQVNRTVDKTMGSIVSGAQSASAVFGQLASGAGGLAKSMLDSASQMQQFQARLTAVTGNAAQAKAQLKQMADFAANTPFELPSVVKAGVQLKSLGQDVDKFLPLAGNLAAVMGRDIPDAALALGKAASGSQDGITQLQDSFGVTKRELIAAGAAMQSNGAISVATAGDVEKLQGALQKVIGTKFGNAMEAQSHTLKGAFSNLGDAVGQLKADMGEALAPAAETVARSLTKVVEAIRGLPDRVKSTAAYATVATAAVAAFGAALAGTVGVLVPLGAKIGLLLEQVPALTSAVGGVVAAATGLSVAFAATTGALVAVAAAAAVYITLLEAQNKASQALLETELKRADGLRTHHNLLGKSAEEMRKAGATAKDISEMIQGYQEAAEQARKRGDDVAAKRAGDEIRRLKEIQSQFATTEAGKRAEADKTKKAEEAAEKDAELFKKRRTAGVYETKAAELEAMDALLARLSKTSKLYEEFSMERIKLEREVAKEAKTAADKAHKDKFDMAKKEVELLGAQSDQNKQRQIDALRKIHDTFTLTAEEKKGIEIDIARLQKELADQVAAKKKKHDEDEKKRLQDKADANLMLLKAEEQQAEADIKATEERLHRGEDVLNQLKAEISKRDELKKKIADAEAGKAKLDKPKEAGEIDKANAAAKSALDKQAATEQEKLDRQAAERRTKAAAEEVSLQEREAALREEAARREFEAGGRNHDEYVKRLKDRQRLERDALAAKEAAAEAGKSGAELDRQQRQYNVDLAELRQRQTEELRKANKELEQAKASSKEMTGGVQSVEEMAKSLNDAWEGGLKKSEDKSPADLAAARESRAKLEIDLAHNGTPAGKPGPTEPGFRTPSAFEPAQAGSSVSGGSGGGGGGDLVDLMRQAVGYLAKMAGGNTGPSPTQFGDYTTTTNRCF